jgi:hypothetical protein
MRPRALPLLLLAVGGLLAVVRLTDRTVAYPEGYRRWTHVKSGITGPGDPSFATRGGVHHIYANEAAMRGYVDGHFPDGAVLAFDVIALDTNSGGASEGARRLLDVMERDSARFASTGGWDFEEFRGSTRERLLGGSTAEDHSRGSGNPSM